MGYQCNPKDKEFIKHGGFSGEVCTNRSQRQDRRVPGNRSRAQWPINTRQRRAAARRRPSPFDPGPPRLSLSHYNIYRDTLSVPLAVTSVATVRVISSAIYERYGTERDTRNGSLHGGATYCMELTVISPPLRPLSRSPHMHTRTN